MSRTIDNYPNIKQVYLDIVYDNGGVYNGMGHMPSRTEEDALDASESVMGSQGVYPEDLQALDDWIASLSSDDRQTLADGEHTDMEALVEQSPMISSGEARSAKLFEDLFEVC